jgi:hypothetical protein
MMRIPSSYMGDGSKSLGVSELIQQVRSLDVALPDYQ